MKRFFYTTTLASIAAFWLVTPILAQRPTAPKPKPAPVISRQARLDAALLRAAASGDDLGILEALDRGANPNTQDKTGRTALLIVATGVVAPTLAELMQKKDLFEHSEAVEILLSNPKVDVNRADVRGVTPLYQACERGEQELVEMLFARGAAWDMHTKTGRTTLMAAARSKDQDLVTWLLSKGADINARDAGNNTALLLALRPERPAESYAQPRKVKRSGDEMAYGGSMATLLLEKGADPKIVAKDGLTPLHFAVAVETTGTIRRMLTAGADPNAAEIKGKLTPLMLSIVAGRADSVRLLLSHGSNPNQSVALGGTPLMAAVYSGGYATVEMLLKAGADKSAKSTEGITVMDLARAQKRIAITQLLQSPAPPK